MPVGALLERQPHNGIDRQTMRSMDNGSGALLIGMGGAAGAHL